MQVKECSGRDSSSSHDHKRNRSHNALCINNACRRRDVGDGGSDDLMGHVRGVR